MIFDVNSRGSALNKRHGIATLEFVLAMPTLFLLIVAIVWLGYWMVYQTELNVAARNDAWKQRFDNPDSSPLIFPSLPIYSKSSDHKAVQLSKRVNVSDVMDDARNPLVTQSILAGTWDHRRLPMDAFPNWQLYGKAVLNSKTGDSQNLLASLTDFKHLAVTVARNVLNDVAGLSELKDLLSKVNSPGDSGVQQVNSDRQQEHQALTLRKRQIEEELLPLQIRNRTNSNLSAADKRRLIRLRTELWDVREDLDALR